MVRGRVSPSTRRVAVVAALLLASAGASLWRQPPERPRVARAAINLLPPIFTSIRAQSDTGCTGTANGTFGTTSATGVLSITMNSLTLIDQGATSSTSDDVEVSLPGLPQALNFASTSGVNVGSFVNGASVPAGTYEAIRIVMDNTFRILCGVTCNGQTYVTKGGSANTDPDGVGGAASQSSLQVATSPQSYTLVFSDAGQSPITVSSGTATTKNLSFSASGACKLWDISTLLSHSAGTDYKIMPVLQTPQSQ